MDTEFIYFLIVIVEYDNELSIRYNGPIPIMLVLMMMGRLQTREILVHNNQHKWHAQFSEQD